MFVKYADLLFILKKFLKKKNTPKCEWLKLLCKTLKNCFDKTFCLVLESLYKKFCVWDSETCCINDSCDCCFDCYDFYCFCCCIDNDYSDEEQKCKCCCCDFCQLDDIEYEQNHVYFCYCYQNKRTFKWVNSYISSEIQKKLSPYLLEYFFLQLLTIAFEKQYKINIDDNNKNEVNYDFNELIIFIIIFVGNIILFFYFTISYSNYFEPNVDEAQDIAEKIEEISNNILY